MSALARVVVAVVLTGTALSACGNDVDDAGSSWPRRDVRLLAPADPGGGWDTTAREMARVLEREAVIDKGVEVYNVPGAGGTIGLAQLASKRKGRSDQIMVMGLVMLGAIETNQAPVDLGETTPIAAITSEPEAIVVKADSPIRDLGDLVAQMKREPRKTSFAGGSAGGTDQILMGLLAKAAGVDPSQPKYVAYSGGGEAVQAILSGSVTAGISGASEFEDQVDAGKLRFLAVSTPERVEVGGEEIPTIREQGLDVVVQNWRGLVAPPEIERAERDAMVAAVERMRATPGWREALERNGWTDFWRPGDAFDRFIAAENRRVEQIVEEIGLSG
jgi:putative tricarboxylic transport membrane protein